MQIPEDSVLKLLRGSLAIVFLASCSSPPEPRLGEAEQPTQSVAAQPSVAPPPSAPTIDPTVQDTAREFTNRLKRNVGGTLVSISENDGAIRAKWTSPRCDWTEAEVVDLLISLHREFKGEVRSIAGERTCSGMTRSYTLSGSDFRRYRTGQIKDTDVLKGLK